MAVGFEVGKGCVGAVAAATVNGASAPFTISTANASSVLNITGLTVNFSSMAGTQVGAGRGQGWAALQQQVRK